MKKKFELPASKYIKRCYEFSEARAEASGNTITGHAAVYGQVTSIGGWFNEIIAPGAFDRTDLSDVALFLNHDFYKIPLARSRKSIPNSTMRVAPDEQGLLVDATVDTENNAEAKALVSAVARKDITGMSFAFLVGDEEWQGLDTDMPTRTIKSISKVIEVSAVTYPAYQGTDIDARSQSLESDRAALEKARSAMIDRSKELEILKFKTMIRSKL